MEAALAAEARRFGKYTLVAKLATGGMAEIFLARLQGDGGFEKLVCIKRILPQLARDPQFVAMFLDEARVAARISHPNVCQVFELGELEGRYYIAMEYLEGMPLAVFRRREAGPPVDARLVAGFGVQACEGLHHAHQLKAKDGELLGVVHRDVSPQNLFVTVDGIVKVLDFGIAKVQDASARTSTGAVKGTYAYMAPEQLRNEKLDRRTDVWAVGTVLWETLARRPLFKRDTEFLTFQAIVQDPIPDIRELRPDVPGTLSEVIACALSRDRDGRFPSARALGEALAQAVMLDGGPLGAPAIADELAVRFGGLLEEQHRMLAAAREGGEFDLESSNPLGGYTQIATTPTPVSSLRRQAEAAQAEVAELAAALPGAEVAPQRRSEPYAVPTRRSEPRIDSPYSVAPMAWRTGMHDSAPVPGVDAPKRISSVMPVAPAGSRLPWIIALVAVGAAGAAGALLYAKSRMQVPVAAVAAASPAGATSAGAANAAAGGSAAAAGAATGTVTGAAAGSATATDAVAKAATEPGGEPGSAAGSGEGSAHAVPARTKPHHEVVREHAERAHRPSGPPGYITIDSAPVYASIYVDGKALGDTPLVHVSLAPGRHVVRAVSPSGAAKTVAITIEPGKTAPPRRIEW